MTFILVHVNFLSSRCMFELKFAICHRAASLVIAITCEILSAESIYHYFKILSMSVCALWKWDVRGWDYNSDVGHSYLLYFVLCVHDNKRMQSRRL